MLDFWFSQWAIWAIVSKNLTFFVFFSTFFEKKAFFAFLSPCFITNFVDAMKSSCCLCSRHELHCSVGIRNKNDSKYIVIMKKIILSFLLCVGVGFAMMGSPAQVGDNGNKQTRASASNVADDELQDKGVCHTNPLIKQELKVRNLDRVLKSVSKRNLSIVTYRDYDFTIVHEYGTGDGSGNRFERKSSAIVDKLHQRMAGQTHGGKPIIDVPDPPIVVGPNGGNQPGIVSALSDRTTGVVSFF